MRLVMGLISIMSVIGGKARVQKDVHGSKVHGVAIAACERGLCRLACASLQSPPYPHNHEEE
jgi:hypothetical protein